jgi:hypothetical protein
MVPRLWRLKAATVLNHTYAFIRNTFTHHHFHHTPMKRKSAWLSFTACALTAASAPHAMRAAEQMEIPFKTQECRVCPLRTGAPVVPMWSVSAKGAQKFQQ